MARENSKLFSRVVNIIKPLLPSLRERQRYLQLKVTGSITNQEIIDAIQDFIGVIGMAKAHVTLLKKNILMVDRGSVDLVKSALCLINKASVDVIKTSGLLGKLKGGN